MKYRVIKAFTDLKDGNFAYHSGDEFPREGASVTKSRIKELSSDKNPRKEPLIESVEEEKEATKTYAGAVEDEKNAD